MSVYRNALLLLAPLSVLSASAWPEEPAAPRASVARLANAADVRRRLKLIPEYDQLPGIERVKIAILDHGFGDPEGLRGYLPETTTLVEHYDPALVRCFDLGDAEYQKELDRANAHGRHMAQMIWGVTGQRPAGPRFYLLNANGPTMLRRAVRYAIQERVDIILFSSVFEGGGNGDGRGFINRIVADALAAGIIWINAAGNYGRRVYNGPIRPGGDGYLRFRDGADGAYLRFRNRLDENPVTVTLTWNDYRETEDAGTIKDLDLFVEDAAGRRMKASQKNQVPAAAQPGPEDSRNPRERVVLDDLPASGREYRIRIHARGREAFGPDDRLRVLVTAARETYIDPATGKPAEALTFVDASGRGEIFPPADNPLVLTVGDSSRSSAIGPTADYRVKPDVILEDSRAYFSDGQVSEGSSNAAAYFAGAVALLKAAEPGLKSVHLLDLARGRATSSQPSPNNNPVREIPFRGSYIRLTFPDPGLAAVKSPRSTTLAATPPPAEQGEQVPSWVKARVWRTPSRARLAEVLR